MNCNVNNSKVEEIKLQYAFGDCAIFAVALSRIIPLPIVEFYAGNDMYHVALVLEGKNINEDQFFDVYGINYYKDIKKRYSMKGKQNLVVKTEQELRHMSIFNEEDIMQATKDIDFMLQHGFLSDYIITKNQHYTKR